MSKTGFKSRWLWFSLAILTYLVLLGSDALPYLRGPSVPQWRWLYDSELALERAWPAAIVLALALGILGLMDRVSPGRLTPLREIGFLAALIVLMVSAQATVLFIERADLPSLLFDRIISPTADGYFSVAVEVSSIDDLLRNFPAHMVAFPHQHPSTHPPGILLLYLGVIRLAEHLPALAEPLGMWVRQFRCADLGLMALTNAQLAGAFVLAVVKPLLSALTLLPLYGVGKRLVGSVQALRAALVYALVPAVSLFAVQTDPLYALFACLALLGLVLAVEQGRWWWALPGGLALSVATFMSVVNLMLLAPLAIYCIIRLAAGACEDRPALGRVLASAALFLGGLATVWILYWAVYGVGLFEILSAGTHDLALPALPADPGPVDLMRQIAARMAAVNGGRSYWIWLPYNVYDFLAFLGLPLLALLGPAGVKAARSARARRLTPGPSLTLAFVVSLLVLSASGIIRGEVGRIWVFLMPLGALAAAEGLDSRRRPIRLVVVLMLVQTVVFAASLTVVDLVLWPRPTYESQFVRPAVQIPAGAEFGGRVRLLGYDLDATTAPPGGTFGLELHWQSMAPMPVSYKVFVHLQQDNSDGIRGQYDGIPLQGEWPTTCWVQGEVVNDQFQIPVAADAPPGAYWLAVGLYHEESGLRLPVGDGDSVRLGPVQVAR